MQTVGLKKQVRLEGRAIRRQPGWEAQCTCEFSVPGGSRQGLCFPDPPRHSPRASGRPGSRLVREMGRPAWILGWIFQHNHSSAFQSTEYKLGPARSTWRTIPQSRPEQEGWSVPHKREGNEAWEVTWPAQGPLQHPEPKEVRAVRSLGSVQPPGHPRLQEGGQDWPQLWLDVSPIDRHRTLCATEPASLAQSGSVSAWKLYSKGWCSVSWRQ